MRLPLAKVAALSEGLSPESLRRLAAYLQEDERTGGRALARELGRRIHAIDRARARDETLRRFDAAFGRPRIAGVDEVGRGALAGPLVAAAVVLRPGTPLLGLDDSKRLTVRQREGLFGPILRSAAAWCIAVATPNAIDCAGMGQANRHLLTQAALGLGFPPDLLIVDAFRLPDYPWEQYPTKRADAKSQAVAAASVVAKVVRDRMMTALGENDVPGYGFEHHVGYASSGHVRALRAMGASLLHRRSFLGFLASEDDVKDARP